MCGIIARLRGLCCFRFVSSACYFTLFCRFVNHFLSSFTAGLSLRFNLTVILLFYFRLSTSFGTFFLQACGLYSFRFFMAQWSQPLIMSSLQQPDWNLINATPEGHVMFFVRLGRYIRWALRPFVTCLFHCRSLNLTAIIFSFRESVNN